MNKLKILAYLIHKNENKNMMRKTILKFSIAYFKYVLALLKTSLFPKH